MTHGFVNSMLTRGDPEKGNFIYSPSTTLTRKEEFINGVYILNEAMNDRLTPSQQESITALSSLLKSIPEGSNLILGACSACSMSDDLLGKALVELSGNRINVFISQGYVNNPHIKGATRLNKEDWKNVRFLDVPLGVRGSPDADLEGWILFPKEGGAVDLSSKNIRLNSTGKPVEIINKEE